MYYNKRTVVRSDRIQMIWGKPENYDMYQNYIDELNPEDRFEKYYFVSPALAVKHYTKYLIDIGKPYSYEEAIKLIIKDVTESKRINDDLDNGNTCIIFDMGVEYVTEETYRSIDNHFSKSKFNKHVKYWTMFENCKWTGTIEIISASSSTCRFADWDYEQGQKDIQESLPEYYDTHYKPETNKLTGKRFLFLNRRLRNHRILLLAELLKRKTNIDADFYMSFLGSENEHIPKEWDKETIDGLNYIKRYDAGIFNSIWKDYYGRKLPYSVEMSRDEWLAGSNLNRITEMLPFRNKTFVEIITEFQFNDDGLVSISEKLSQAILSKKPFIIVGDKNYMKVLQDLGFKTFNEFWSEEYDVKDTIVDRVISIGDTIQYIQENQPITLEHDKIVYNTKLQQVLEYNYNHYKNTFSKNVYERIFKSLSVNNEYVTKLGITYDSVDLEKDYKDYFWYSENTNVGVIPIYNNCDRFFAKEIAPRLGFRYVKYNQVKDADFLILTRDPLKRFMSSVIDYSNTKNIDVDKILLDIENKKLDFTLSRSFRHQTYNLPDNIKGTIDLDYPNRDGYYYKSEWGIDDFGQREIMRGICDILQPIDDYVHLNENIGDIVFDYYSRDYMFYFTKGSWRHRKPYGRDTISSAFNEYLKYFNKEYAKEIKKIKRFNHAPYFLGSLDSTYWLNHTMIMDNLGLNYAPKDIKILDMGTHFGFIPHFLKQHGFTNVDCCNSFKEAGADLVELKKIWSMLDLNPYDVHISPGKPFELKTKYDIITINMSNMFWNSDKVVRLHDRSVNQSWEITDENGDKNTFFVPWLLSDLDWFVKFICNWLEPGGICIAQPYPYVYHKFEGFEQENNFVKYFQDPQISHSTPRSSKHNPDGLLTNYFVIQNNVNANTTGAI